MILVTNPTPITPASSNAEFTEAVQRGITMLDKVWPTLGKEFTAYPEDRVTDWRALMDRDTLNLAEFEQCVLGQITGSYRDAAEMLGLTENTAAHFGFYLSDAEFTGEEERDRFSTKGYDRLTDTWRDAIFG